MADEENKTEEMEPVENQKVMMGMLAAILVVGLIVGGGYLYSRKKSGQTVFPSGYQPPLSPGEIDCSKSRPANANVWDYYNKCDKIKLGADGKLQPLPNDKYRFSVLAPNNIKYVNLSNGLFIVYKDIAPNINPLYTLDLASSRSGELAILKGEDYVRNYWRQYPGLTGLKSLESIVNGSGAVGYKAVYIIGGTKEGNQEIFFELGNKTGDFVHFTPGILDPQLYDTIIGSFQYTTKGTPSPRPSPKG